MIAKWFLHGSNHQDEIFLQSNWQLIPFQIRYTHRNVCMAIGSNVPIVAIQKVIRNAKRHSNHHRSHTKVKVLRLLNLIELFISMR